MDLRIAQAAQELRISQKMVRRLVFANALEAKKINGVYKIAASSLEHYKNTQADAKAFALESYEPERALDVKQNEVINWADISAESGTFDISLTSADLFCGAGGMTKGFEMAGFSPLAGLDWFDAAALTYQKHFKHPHIFGDITQENVKQTFVSTLESQLKGKTLTVLSGGFPCQGFSMSGSRLVDDARNSLYKDMLEIIRRVRPLFIVAENVKGLRSMLGGRVEKKIKEDIEALGYCVNIATLNAADYGVPQKRERVIFIANRLGLKNFHPAPLLQPNNYVRTKDAIGDLVGLDDSAALNHVKTKHSKEMQARLAAVPEGKSLYENYSDAWKKCPWNEASCTIKENHGGVNIHPIEPRVITVREMARLQSFPDDFIFHGSKAKQMVQIGNAVPPLLAKAIALAVRRSLNTKK